MSYVVVTEADYTATYTPVFGGVYGPYDTAEEAEAAMREAGYIKAPDTVLRDGRTLEGDWIKKDVGWSGETATIEELTPMPALGESESRDV